MINKEVLKKAESHITEKISSFSGIPEELINTIANIYYQYWSSLPEEIAQTFFYGDLPEMKNIEEKVWGKLTFDQKKTLVEKILAADFGIVNSSLAQEYSFLITAVEFSPKLLGYLQNIRDKADDDGFNFAVEHMLWNFKYRIKNTSTKTILRCKIEKKMKEGSVLEIKDLFKEMNIG